MLQKGESVSTECDGFEWAGTIGREQVWSYYGCSGMNWVVGEWNAGEGW